MPEESKKEIGTARVVFSSRFQAFVDYQTPEEDIVSRERDLIQLFSLTFVRILFLLGENKQVPMLMQYVQAAMGDTVTPKGLQRPTIMGKDQTLLQTCPEKPETLAVFKLTQDHEVRKAE